MTEDLLFKHQTHYLFDLKQTFPSEKLLFSFFTDEPEEIKMFWDEKYCTFIIDKKKHLFRSHKSTHGLAGFGDGFKVQPKGYNVDEFIILLKSSSGLVVTADFLHGILPSFTNQTSKYEDYSGMITGLELAGKLVTSESEGIMATDPRRFNYNGEEYEVDCLGTKYCQDITKKIEKEWINLKRKNTSDNAGAGN